VALVGSMVGQVETKLPERCELARGLADRLAARPYTPMRRELGGGDLGVALALLHAHEICGDERYGAAGRALVHEAVRHLEEHPPARAGLFDGMAGLVWVLVEYTERDPRHAPALRVAADRLAEHLITVSTRPGPERLRLYDLARGAAGQVVPLARASQVLGSGPGDVVGEAVDRLTHYLLKAAEIGDDGVPNWLVPSASYSVPFFRRDFPHGLYNPGMEHGIAGVLAALCAIAEQSPADRRVRRKITELSDWLAWCRIDGPAGPAWPVLLRADASTGAPVLDPFRAAGRTAWCHGAPGIADALLAAAAVTGRTGIRQLAMAALDRVIATPEEERRVTDAGLCHGMAGLVTAFSRAHRWTGAPRYLAARDDAARTLAELAERDELRRDGGPGARPSRGNGLLTGSAGVLLALLGTAEPSAAWDTVLFLSTPRRG
jgi:lantibiotic modifying enzyme